MSANLDAKKLVVEEIKQKISQSKSISFVDFRGLSVDKDTQLRHEFKANNAEYKVYKNRLVQKALNQLGITGCDEYLQGSNAVIFGYADEVTAPKILVKNIETNKILDLKFGIINGVFASKDDMITLSRLASKEELIAKLLSVLNGPVTALTRVLSAPTQGLAIALSEVANKN